LEKSALTAPKNIGKECVDCPKKYWTFQKLFTQLNFNDYTIFLTNCENIYAKNLNISLIKLVGNSSREQILQLNCINKCRLKKI
jgi:hypothetical protein